jgi:hypothetical protein
MGSQRERPGFDFAASFIGQGKYFDCPFVVNGAAAESKGWVDDVSTDYAVDFLRRSKDKPFLLVVGYKATHGPALRRSGARTPTRARRPARCRTWM